jgi:hypothetical protein
MRLFSLSLQGHGPLAGLSLRFADAEGAPRPMVVLFGGDGTGKTSVLSAIAHTRPGYALPLLPRPRPRLEGEDASTGFAVAEWLLGDDDPERPHTLRVTSPNAKLDEADDVTLMARREQAFFDKKAQEGRGFLCVVLSGARWFSRTSVMLTTPERTIMRYDVRANATFDDATRADMTRETKQVLSFASIASALERNEEGAFASLDRALHEVCAIVLRPFDLQYRGADPATLEPIFAGGSGRSVLFDDIPKGARHLVTIVVHAVRALYSSIDGDGDPRVREGLVLVDDAESQLDPAIQRAMPQLLREALPRVQWVLATASPAVTLGCQPGEVLALRRDADRIAVHEGTDAVIH